MGKGDRDLLRNPRLSASRKSVKVRMQRVRQNIGKKQNNFSSVSDIGGTSNKLLEESDCSFWSKENFTSLAHAQSATHEESSQLENSLCEDFEAEESKMDDDDSNVNGDASYPDCRKEMFPETSNDTLLVSSEIPLKKYSVEGRRIVNISHFFEEFKKFKHMELFNCTTEFLNIIHEYRQGLTSIFTIKCENCLEIKKICTEDKTESLDVNKSMILGILSTGGGFSQLQEISASCNIPSMSAHFYAKEEELIGDHINVVLWKMMEAAGKEEANIARNLGQVDSDGVPLITVIADGAWSKRSYNLNYNALSGVGCIVGYHTKKLLFIGIKNKYCCVCERAANKNEVPKIHRCFKNWDNSTTSMEADIIVEGFCKSMELHGVKYANLIGDGDSSVTKKLQEARPYGTMLVHKIECSNHLLRNYCNKLRNLTKKRINSKCNFVPVQQRNNLTKNMRRLRNAITCAVIHHNKTDENYTEKIVKFKRDVLNSPHHVFGDHTNCAEYFCKGTRNEEKNHIPQMKESGLYDDILTCASRLASNAESLLSNMDNNAAEHYNSIVAKFVGGKRVNYSLKGSYKMRCEAAGISYNSDGNYYQQIHQSIVKSRPGKYTQKFEERKKKIQNYNKQYRKYVKRKENKNKIIVTADRNYGPEAEIIPDMLPEVYAQLKDEFLKNIAVNEEQCDIIERQTIQQANCKIWKDERAKRLCSSVFGTICKLRRTTSAKNTIKNILYTEFFGSTATKYGKDNECAARIKFEEITGLQVRECGLFINSKNYFLATSPDGLVGENAVIEIKCPYSARNLSPKEAIEKRKITCFCIEDGEIKIKKNHNYFYQIQGQLQLAKREICYFIIWTPHGIHYDKVYKDNSFWETKMLPKLKQFYFEGLLPEIIDPRYTRGQEIRDFTKN